MIVRDRKVIVINPGEASTLSPAGRGCAAATHTPTHRSRVGVSVGDDLKWSLSQKSDC